MTHGRKYGEKPSYPIYVWNGLLERKHRERVGPAIWEFLWCINAITFEKDGKGFVLGGAPVDCKKIADGSGVNEQTIRLHFDLLERWSYIERTRTPRGYAIRVLNSAKFVRKGVQSDRGKTPDHSDNLTGEESPITPTKTPDHFIRNPRSNKRKQLEQSVEQASVDLWALLKLDPATLRPPFKKHCEELFAVKNGQPMGEFVGVCMDAWELLGNRIPAPFYKAVASFRERERSAPIAAAPITFLPEVPFKPKEEPCPKKS